MQLSEETKKSLMLSLLGLDNSTEHVASQVSTGDNPNGAWRILILQRGRVVVGRVFKDGNYYRVEDCSCVRQWGTTKGLGEIATDGPTSSTKLDKQPTTRVHELAVVEHIDCEASKWN